MQVPKVLGIETEYGIAGGPEKDPILASSIIVNAYALEGRTRINWDFDSESPSSDSRGVLNFTSFAPIVETHLANTVLTNGARLYVDHAHPEYSSPECRTPLEATLFDVAGEEVMLRAMNVSNQSLDPSMRMTLYKNNCDGKGNSYGTHENYLLSRDLEFKEVVAGVVPHFVSRQIIFGAGKVGAETEDGLEVNPAFQISQRAEFFEEVVGLETTLKRPIVNTRDEPHSDAERYRRLHVIIGDANMSQVATFVKLGSTSLLLSLLEAEGAKVFPSMPVHPVQTVRSFAIDTSLSHAVLCEDGKKRTAWDFQDELWNLADSFVQRTGAPDVAGEHEVSLIMKQWREMLDGVRDNPASVADRVDWVAKLRIIEGLKERYGLHDYDAKLRAVDLQYHDLRKDKSLSKRVGLVELFTSEQVSEAVHNPPRTTRAYFRGQCVTRYPEQIVAANWDSLVFDLGEGPLQRVPMLDPLRGTAELTQDLLEKNPSVSALLKAMNG